ncbi:MAG: site-2 protease family protein [Myxococcales bacterium]|nr:site-2 protease family protein [Myxococcales bacterium]
MFLVVVILGLSLLIVVHEFGHFIAARAVGMRVIKFSIGFGPSVLRVKGRETTWQIGALPIGGYVQVEGLGGASEGDELDAIVRRRHDAPERSYEARPLWQRTLFVAAGPAFNFLFAIAVLTGLYAAGRAVTVDRAPTPTLVIKEMAAPSAAAAAGLLPGDVIERIDGKRVASFAEVRRATGGAEGRALRITVARPPAGAALPVEPRVVDELGLVIHDPAPPAEWPRLVFEVTPLATPDGPRLGFSPAVVRFGAEGFAGAVALGARETWALTTMVFQMIGKLFAGSDEVRLGSPVAMVRIGTDHIEKGWEWFAFLLAFFSVNLGLLNLLPIPGLDGGRLSFIAVEAIARRPVPRRFEMVVHAVGLLILFGVIAVVVVRDVAEAIF